jgi:GT2 family glycosyltransferase
MILVGIVTCNRVNFFDKCYNSIKAVNGVDKIVVVNDGTDAVNVDKDTVYIKHNMNQGVAKSKNEILKLAIKEKADHTFIFEDDIIIKDNDALHAYINASKLTGIQHFCFAYHGPANKGNVSKGKPMPRFIVDYGSIKISINAHSVGAMCYYSKRVLEDVGIIDEDFLNAFEHVEHSYRIAKQGYCPPYWNWPDLANSMDYLDELECSEKSSTIRDRKDWMQNIQNGAALFLKKHGMLPAWQNCVPDTSKQEVTKILKEIHKKYAIKD